MIQDPMDMFAEMDELFERIFTRMEREFTAGLPDAGEYETYVANEAEPAGTGPGSAPAPSTSFEPLTEVHTIGDEVKVVTELPGATDGEVRLRVKGTTLVIDAGDGDHHYHTTATLPTVDAASMQRTLKNGILEVTFRIQPGSHNGTGTGRY